MKAIRGRDIVVKCEASSNPAPSYKWSNNVSGQSLRLHSVSLSDERSYTCTVTNIMIPSQGSYHTASVISSFSLDVLCKLIYHYLTAIFIHKTLEPHHNHHLKTNSSKRYYLMSLITIGVREPSSKLQVLFQEQIICNFQFYYLHQSTRTKH